MLIHSVMPISLRPHGLHPARLLCPWGFSREEYWSGLPCPSPGDVPNPEVEPRPPTLQADSLPVEPPGKPKNTGLNPFSSRSSWPRNQTKVSCIAGGFFTTWGENKTHKQAPHYCSSNSLIYNCSSMTKYTEHIKGLISVKSKSKSPKQGLNLSF